MMRIFRPAFVLQLVLISFGFSMKGADFPELQLYQTLREASPAESYAVENYTISRDVAEFQLRSGTLSFAAPVGGRVTLGVFVGEGELKLSPPGPIEQNYLERLSGMRNIAEPFAAAVFYFTDETYTEFTRGRRKTELDPKAAPVLKKWRGRMRTRGEFPRTLGEDMVTGEMMDNLDAEVLTDLLGPKRPGLFTALIAGHKYDNLRFHLRPRGAVSGKHAPEELLLVNVDTNGSSDGILYWSHLMTDSVPLEGGAHPGQRFVKAEDYRVETTVEKNDHLTATTRVKLRGLVTGERVLKFALLHSLRVSEVLQDGQAAAFVQEPRTGDSTLYVVLPKPTVRDGVFELELRYQGDRVLRDAGGGNYSVGARTSWYPTVNPFSDWSTYHLKFRVPKKFNMVSIGKLINEERDGDYQVSEWASETPVPVAGFNFGQFKRKAIENKGLNYLIEGYAASELPNYMQAASTMEKLPGVHGRDEMGGLTPSRLLDRAISESDASLKIYSRYFGALPYGRIAITQQPEMHFGQSWPTLVYLPVISFLDSTQRWRMMGNHPSLTNFVNEVTAHEVSHQWWGHRVGWATFHDQWMSEGFAEFSTSLFLQDTNPKLDQFNAFWDELRTRILKPSRAGAPANEAGPLWLGRQLATRKNESAYSYLVYSKGAYVLHMLRMMMHYPRTGDQPFIDLMQDFVKRYAGRAASTEDFQALVEKHMMPAMDLEKNHRMDWFFRNWVYGTEVPHYHLDYTVAEGEGAGAVVKVKITQSEVSNDFLMLVPIYADFDGQIVKLGAVRMIGPTTVDNISIPLPRKPKRILLNAWHDVLER